MYVLKRIYLIIPADPSIAWNDMQVEYAAYFVQPPSPVPHTHTHNFCEKKCGALNQTLDNQTLCHKV